MAIVSFFLSSGAALRVAAFLRDSAAEKSRSLAERLNYRTAASSQTTLSDTARTASVKLGLAAIRDAEGWAALGREA